MKKFRTSKEQADYFREALARYDHLAERAERGEIRPAPMPRSAWALTRRGIQASRFVKCGDECFVLLSNGNKRPWPQWIIECVQTQVMECVEGEWSQNDYECKLWRVRKYRKNWPRHKEMTAWLRSLRP